MNIEFSKRVEVPIRDRSYDALTIGVSVDDNGTELVILNGWVDGKMTARIAIPRQDVKKLAAALKIYTLVDAGVL